MSLNFQGYGDPFAKQKMEDQQKQQQFQNLIQALGMVGNGVNQYQDRQRQASMDAITKQKHQNDQFLFDRDYGVQQGGSNPFMGSDMNQMSTPMGDQGPQNKLSLFQGGQGQPQVSSDIVAMHKKMFPHFANVTDSGIPSGMSRADYEDQQKYQKQQAETGYLGAETTNKYAEARKNLAQSENKTKFGSEYGKAPTGFRYTPTGDLESIPGGPADLKSQADKQKSDLALAGQKDKAQLIMGKIDQALSKVGYTTAGIGSFSKNIPMTSAKNLSSDLETVKALLGFEQLGEMKNQSRAGASGLGALSDREMNLLTSARANLDQAQSPDQLRERLNEIKGHFNNWLKMEEGINPYQNSPPGQPQQPQQNQSNVIIQRNVKTGQRRQSNDGGKTWTLLQ